MKIDELRKKAGISQSEAAKQLGITSGDYKAIEKETIAPTMNQLAKLADLFGITVDALIGRKSPISLSRGETVWLNIRKSLSQDKLEVIAQMLNGVGGLQLSDNDIINICDTSNDCLTSYNEQAQYAQLFNAPKEEDVLTFDDFLILFKIYSGEKFAITFNESDVIKTKYSFTYEGKFYSSAEVSKILNRLCHKFGLMDSLVTFYETKKGIKWGDTYPKLNRKAKTLIQEKESEFKV